MTWAGQGARNPSTADLARPPFPGRSTSCYSTRPGALWKEALEGGWGGKHHRLGPAHSFQPCHARTGVLGSPGGWQLSHQVRL